MKKNNYLKKGNNSNLKTIRVKSPYSLYIITKKLKRDNLDFKIIQKQNSFEIEIDASKIVKGHKFNRATGSVFMAIKGESTNETIPSTPKTSPPNKKKDKDLSDR